MLLRSPNLKGFAIMMAVFIGALTPLAVESAPPMRVTLCHQSDDVDGDVPTWHLISVSENAVAAHLAEHGDAGIWTAGDTVTVRGQGYTACTPGGAEAIE